MAEQNYSLMKESWSMVLTYVTAMVLVFVLTFHLLLQSPLMGKTFQDTYVFSTATKNLTYYQVVFGFLLFAAIIHGLNGLRVIALEWFHPQKRAWLLNLIVIVLISFFLAMGFYTLVAVG